MASIIGYFSSRVKNFDKYLHFIIGFTIALLTSLIEPGFASSVGTLAGYLKEEYDSKHPDKHTYDGWDAYTTAAGAVVGQMVGLYLEKVHIIHPLLSLI
jgi:hypothetical protein